MKLYRLHIKLFVSILLSFFTSISRAQNKFIDPVTLNASSGTYKTMFQVIDWNFGESFTASLTDKNKLLITSGFLQSKAFEQLIIPAVDTLQFLDKNPNYLTVSPTLVTDFLRLKNSQPLFKIVDLTIYDINGNLLKIIEEPYSTPAYTQKINIQHLTNGTYILMAKYIINQKYYRVKVFKFIKM